MIGGKFSFRIFLALLFVLSGCATGDKTYVMPGDRYVRVKEKSTSHVVNPDTGAGIEGIKQTRYVARAGRITRITPERPLEAGAGEKNLDPVEAEFRAASTPELIDEFIEKYAPTRLAFVAIQNLARPAIEAGNWSAAVDIFEKYRERFPFYEDLINEIIETLEAQEEGLKIANLGGVINSSQGEYSPVITADGKRIYFARECGECSGEEEVYVSVKDANGEWGPAYRFGEPLSSKGNEIPLGVSSDNTTLAVFGNYPGSLGRGDIFYVHKNQDGWGDLQHYPSPLNTENFESNAMYTADGKAMLFISERPGGVGDFHEKGKFYNGSYTGNTDIYVYTIGDGDNAQVLNLGPVINTPYGEYSPYLHPDGKTLYFSSNGHPGLGELDVFKSTRLSDDSWTEWSEPVNLGKEINSPYNDWGYQVAAKGDEAYFSRSGIVNGYGSSDIYSITLPEQVRPDTVITVSGVVTDPNEDPLVAEIRWDNLDKQQEVGYAQSDPITGEYVIHLPEGGNYGYYAEKPGYIGESENFDLRGYADAYKEFVLDIVLYPIEQPAAVEPEVPVEKPVIEIRMNNLFFDFNKSELRSESYMEMNRWIRMLKENPHVRLHVSGHADSVGTEEFNQKLSERRAKAVVDYLVKNGIDLDRMVARGFGESLPVADNGTPEGRQRNRRVQVRILNSAQ